jgi:hypothetical protein
MNRPKRLSRIPESIFPQLSVNQLLHRFSGHSKRHKHGQSHHRHHHQHQYNQGAAICQVKWRDADGDYSAPFDSITLKGSVDLIRSKFDPTDYRLFVESPDGDTLNIPLPFDQDWNITSQCAHSDNGAHTLLVRLSFTDTACLRQVRILLGLPFREKQKDSREKAKEFCDTLIVANLKSGSPG